MEEWTMHVRMTRCLICLDPAPYVMTAPTQEALWHKTGVVLKRLLGHGDREGDQEEDGPPPPIHLCAPHSLIVNQFVDYAHKMEALEEALREPYFQSLMREGEEEELGIDDKDPIFSLRRASRESLGLAIRGPDPPPPMLRQEAMGPPPEEVEDEVEVAVRNDPPVLLREIGPAGTTDDENDNGGFILILPQDQQDPLQQSPRKQEEDSEDTETGEEGAPDPSIIIKEQVNEMDPNVQEGLPSPTPPPTEPKNAENEGQGTSTPPQEESQAFVVGSKTFKFPLNVDIARKPPAHSFNPAHPAAYKLLANAIKLLGNSSAPKSKPKPVKRRITTSDLAWQSKQSKKMLLLELGPSASRTLLPRESKLNKSYQDIAETQEMSLGENLESNVNTKDLSTKPILRKRTRKTVTGAEAGNSELSKLMKTVPASELRFRCLKCGERKDSFFSINQHISICAPLSLDTATDTTTPPVPIYTVDEHGVKTSNGMNECGLCPKPEAKAFKRFDHLKRHLAFKHGVINSYRPKICCFCNETFYELLKHQSSMHKKEFKIMCDICHNKFPTQNALANHKRRWRH